MATIEDDRLLEVYLWYMKPRFRYQFACMVMPGLQRIITESGRAPTSFERTIFEIVRAGPPRRWWQWWKR